MTGSVDFDNLNSQAMKELERQFSKFRRIERTRVVSDRKLKWQRADELVRVINPDDQRPGHDLHWQFEYAARVCCEEDPDEPTAPSTLRWHWQTAKVFPPESRILNGGITLYSILRAQKDAHVALTEYVTWAKENGRITTIRTAEEFIGRRPKTPSTTAMAKSFDTASPEKKRSLVRHVLNSEEGKEEGKKILESSAKAEETAAAASPRSRQEPAGSRTEEPAKEDATATVPRTPARKPGWAKIPRPGDNASNGIKDYSSVLSDIQDLCDDGFRLIDAGLRAMLLTDYDIARLEVDGEVTRDKVHAMVAAFAESGGVPDDPSGLTL